MHIQAFMWKARTDSRIKPAHICVYLALYQYWLIDHCPNTIAVSRRNIMLTAKIRGIATYHKVMRELVRYGYIEYQPNYDPRTRTMVRLNAIEAIHIG